MENLLYNPTGITSFEIPRGTYQASMGMHDVRVSKRFTAERISTLTMYKDNDKHRLFLSNADRTSKIAISQNLREGYNEEDKKNKDNKDDKDDPVIWYITDSIKIEPSQEIYARVIVMEGYIIFGLIKGSVFINGMSHCVARGTEIHEITEDAIELDAKEMMMQLGLTDPLTGMTFWETCIVDVVIQADTEGIAFNISHNHSISFYEEKLAEVIQRRKNIHDKKKKRQSNEEKEAIKEKKAVNEDEDMGIPDDDDDDLLKQIMDESEQSDEEVDKDDIEVVDIEDKKEKKKEIYKDGYIDYEAWVKIQEQDEEDNEDWG